MGASVGEVGVALRPKSRAGAAIEAGLAEGVGAVGMVGSTGAAGFGAIGLVGS